MPTAAAPVAVDVVGEHCELVAAEAGEKIGGAGDALEAFGNHLQHAVAGAVPVLIVDAFELVEVEHEERVLLPVGLRLQLFQPRQDRAAIGQVGQRVAHRLLAQIAHLRGDLRALVRLEPLLAHAPLHEGGNAAAEQQRQRNGLGERYAPLRRAHFAGEAKQVVLDGQQPGNGHGAERQEAVLQARPWMVGDGPEH